MVVPHCRRGAALVSLELTEEAERGFAATMAKFKQESPTDPFEDDVPLACGIENPEACESCQ